MKLLIATRNEGKFREIAMLFRDTPIRCVSLTDLGLREARDERRLEGTASFAQNAMAKARYFHDRSGLGVLAEDSGLRVDALNGAPGVESKRYAPPAMQAEYGVDRANNLHLLRQLRDVPDVERTAQFYCAAALVLDDESRAFGGRMEGVILRELRGSSGFGYDPLFYLPDRGVTTAELTSEEKNEISHRGRAIRAARDWLVETVIHETRGQVGQ